jgi:hypothetical protein
METLFKVKTNGTDSKNCALKSWLCGYDYIKATNLMHEYNIYTNMQSWGGDYLPFCHVLSYTIFGFVSSDMSTAQTVCSWQRQR